MSSRTNQDTSAMSVEDAAGYWDARLRAPDVNERDRAAHRDWCAADPANADAFDALQRLIKELPDVATQVEIQSMRAAALQRSEGGALLHRLLGPGFLPTCSIAASFAAIVVTGFFFVQSGLQPTAQQIASDVAPSFATDIGERATVPLVDGSAATLNTDSRVLVSYSARERGVTLVRGQAHFNVTRDPYRPFTVHAGKYQVKAIGTAFDVRLEGDNLQVTVTQGRVAIYKVGADMLGTSDVREIIAGEQFEASEGSRAIRRQVNIATVTSWRKGRAVFDDVPLAAAVQELNRHSTLKLIIRDERLASTRISGMFRTGEQVSFADALERYFPISARRQNATEILLEPAPSP